ncbi:MAG: hypothetical protein IT214_02320 [Chitinophagaceae bacterium]|jgi:hypothetical protein|nr:hypothetical protein [Chitinophagaceae bacterium]OQY93992.1 MAG: hypothetical protein B6D37_09660 [Sphingobacteriales bacterium UTBCD1]
MGSNKNILRIILSIAIIIGFFLPWFKFGGGSALDIVMAQSPQDESSTTIVRYSFLLIPLFALIILILSVSNKSSNFILRVLPFLVTAILTALFIAGMKSAGATDEDLKGWLYILAYGYYIVVIASLFLIFI